jgi:hypothetical protein
MALTITHLLEKNLVTSWNADELFWVLGPTDLSIDQGVDALAIGIEITLVVAAVVLKLMVVVVQVLPVLFQPCVGGSVVASLSTLRVLLELILDSVLKRL